MSFNTKLRKGSSFGAVAEDALAKTRRPSEILALMGLSAAYLMPYLAGATAFYPSLNFTGPLVLTLILAWSSYRMASASPILVWSPVFWYRVAFAVYFGLGSFIPLLANDVTKARIYSLHYFDDALHLKINILYTMAITSFSCFSYMFLSPGMLGSGAAVRWPLRSRYRGEGGVLLFALIFLLVGGALRYFIVLPYFFNANDQLIPGVYITLSRVFYAGMYMLVYYVVKNRSLWIFAALPLFVIDFGFSVATFAKQELLLLLMFSFLGYVGDGVKLSRGLVAGAAMLFAFFSFQPLVEFGRASIAGTYGEISGASLKERVAIIHDYINGASGPSEAAEYQSGLVRFSYVNVAAFVIDQYDAGKPGNTLRDGLTIFVPRVLWPGKPVVSLGRELNFLVYGRDTSSLGIGSAAEAYWNFGWLGLPPFMAAVSLILSIITRISMFIMAKNDWLFLPIVLFGVNMGVRVDGFVVPDVLGAGSILLVMWVALSFGNSMYRKLTTVDGASTAPK
ncbi:hypothetical protein [Mesorhizobium sp. M1163]|uniref:hypothetical protein n=1 Tax=Mesorhizobium sp. M1163 TaxID=2957065 RepID=UPI00333AAA46